MSRFQPGQSGNPAGRPKGSKNKRSEEIREAIATLVQDNWDKVQEDLSQLSARERLKVMIELMPYVVPKLQTVSMELDVDKLSDEQVDELYDRILEKTNL